VRFVILGAGAVGGYFGAKLARSGADVFFLARGANLAALRERGFAVTSIRGDFSVAVRAGDLPEEAGRADVLVVTVKAYDTLGAVEPCRRLLAPDGAVLTLQNGLGNLETLSSIFGADRVIGGVAYVGAELAAPGRITHETGGRIVIGEPSGAATPRLARIRDAFEAADVPCETTADLPQAIWEKLVANAVFNVIAAAWNIELGEILKRKIRPLAENAITELVDVAAAEGATVRPVAIEHCWTFCEKYPTFKTSTQQDLARGKPTEWDVLSGELVRRAAKHGIRVPTLEALQSKLLQRSGVMKG
jgi:2-dehydropantoate 2-reductase